MGQEQTQKTVHIGPVSSAKKRLSHSSAQRSSMALSGFLLITNSQPNAIIRAKICLLGDGVGCTI
jgi:hypothetical protein